jgi:hypothetical protein
MKKISKRIASILVLLSSIAYGANDPVVHKGTKTSSVSATGLTGVANNLKTQIDALTASYAAKIEVNTDEIEKFIKNSAEGQGWAAETVADKVAKLVKEAGKVAKAKSAKLAQDLLSSYTTAYAEAVNELDPKGKFQADYNYNDADYGQNKWTAGACNLEGLYTGLSLKGTGTMAFSAGAAVGVMVEADFKIEIKISVSLSLNEFNPVRPTSGEGETLTITATPKWKSSRGGSVGVEAFLSVEVEAEIPANGTLSDIQVTLSVP